jgi:hypothetical protein
MNLSLVAAGVLAISCHYLLAVQAQSLAMDSAGDAAPLETPPRNSSTGLDGAASSGGYYYDK